MNTPFDPLTCPRFDLYTDCNCGTPPGAHHRETCSVTPIYAALAADNSPWEALRDLAIAPLYIRSYPWK